MLIMGRLHGLIASAWLQAQYSARQMLIDAPGPSADPPAARDTADTDLPKPIIARRALAAAAA